MSTQANCRGFNPRTTGLAACAILVAAAAHADHVQVKGVRLEGRVVEVSSTHIHLQTVYGDGVIRIPLAGVEEVATDEPIHIVWGSDRDSVGRLVGVSEQTIEIQREGQSTETITAAAVWPSVPEKDFNESLVERLDRPLALLERDLRSGLLEQAGNRRHLESEHGPPVAS